MSILMCYDGSASSKRALETARSTLSTDEIVLLYVWKPPVIPADSFSEPDVDHGPTTTELECREIERAHEITNQGYERAMGSGLSRVTVRIERKHAGGVPATILDVAEELGSDLIVVGTHGATAVETELLGSVSAPLVEEATIPVLIVPTPKRDIDGSRNEATKVRVAHH